MTTTIASRAIGMSFTVAKYTTGVAVDHVVPFSGDVREVFGATVRAARIVQLHGVTHASTMEVGELLGRVGGGVGGKRAAGLGAGFATASATPIVQLPAMIGAEYVGKAAGSAVGGYAGRQVADHTYRIGAAIGRVVHSGNQATAA